MPRICVFDVQETLLDMSGMDGAFAPSFGAPDATRRAWFAQIIQSAFVGTITGHYDDLLLVAEAALEMVAAHEDVTLSADERQTILRQWRRLPAHTDAHGALQRLQEAGVRLVALSNAPLDLLDDQLRHAGLRHFFEMALSADEVKRLKPAPEPYHMASERLGVKIGSIRLVSAHAWDVAGAVRAGAKAAFVSRPGLLFDPLISLPDAVGEGLTQTVERILEVEGVKK
ncbi:MAG TPA: haloacid dehalogenase type II [Ktedonobacterales bacterium]|nr:haloacid dehalogenase type II [Ktedonobacterales bacterium]